MAESDVSLQTGQPTNVVLENTSNLPAAPAPKTEQNKDAPQETWSPERAKAIVDKYKSEEEIAKALFFQQSENAKYRKELESLKSAPKTQSNPSSPNASTNETIPQVTIKKESFLKRAIQDIFDEDKISDTLKSEIVKANNFTSDEEWSEWESIARQRYDAKAKDAQSVLRMPYKDVLKNAPSVLNDEELLAMHLSIKAGVYDSLKHVERKLLAKSKDQITVQHGSVSNPNSNPLTNKGWANMDEWSEATKNGNVGIPEYDNMIKAKNQATDWAKIRSSMSMGSIRPSLKK